MNEASRRKAAAAEIARLRRAVDQYAAFLRQPAERLLNPQIISLHTGVSPDRVQELLDGELPEVEPDDKESLEKFQRQLFAQRLTFLRQTRTKATPDGRTAMYTLDEIEAATKISSQGVWQLLNGKRGANANHADRLEKYFDQVSRQCQPPSRVPRGFCHLNEGAALIEHLRRMTEVDLRELVLTSLAEVYGAQSVQLRTGGAGADDFTPLLPVLAQLRDDARLNRKDL
ncbi:hypothetical protein [Streptomyces sp. 4N124]|uniref:hypothetical protein n=1 Tax=Streptomyces sp. 4N124 TaxID=3457420 RepID=UPI003FD5CD8F